MDPHDPYRHLTIHRWHEDTGLFPGLQAWATEDLIQLLNYFNRKGLTIT